MDERDLRLSLRSHIENESLDNFGACDKEWLDDVTDSWLNDKTNSKWRYEDINHYKSTRALSKETRILDMACGFSTFVFYGLLNGLDLWGIDPQGWKLHFNRLKCDSYGYPSNWKSRFIHAVGEALPFPNVQFDFVSSYQTLEDVQNVEGCISDMMRVSGLGV